MRYLLGVDFGGGSSKATLIDELGNIIATAAAEYPMLYPAKGYAEQNTEDLYGAFVKNVKDIIAKSKVNPEDIVAMSFDGGTHIGVLLDENNEVIRPAIYWSDSRATEETAEIAHMREEIMEMCYNYPSPSWTLTQMMWLRKHEPENFKKINKIIYLKDYIRFRVTGKLATDSIEAMGALWRDERTNEWSPKLLALSGLTVDQMPEVLNPADIAGTPLPEVCRDTGLSPKTIVAVGATDTAMEVYSSGGVNVGNTTIKLATAGRICPITDKAYPDKQIYCYRHVIPGLWYPGTATKTCAQANRWYRDNLCGGEVYEAAQQNQDAYVLMSAAAAEVPAGADNLFFHPYLQGEMTPYNNTKLRASFTGISSYHTKGHFNRAVLEGVGYSLREGIVELKRLQIPMDETLRIIGGGAKAPLWRQIIADVLDTPVQRVTSDDSSIGSAMLAGVASGVFKTFEDAVNVCTKFAEIVYPNEKNVQVYNEGFKVYKEIQAALEPIYNKL